MIRKGAATSPAPRPRAVAHSLLRFDEEVNVMTGWTFEGRPPVVGWPGAAVTLVEGGCFCLSEANGDIAAGSPQGLFFRDTRFLSRWQVQVNGSGLEPLALEVPEPFAATFVTAVRPPRGHPDSTILVIRRRFVGNGMREDLVLRNLAGEASACSLVIDLDVDFAHLFDVKEGRTTLRLPPVVERADNGLEYSSVWQDHERGLHLWASEPVLASPGHLVAQAVVPARGEWTMSVHLELSTDGFRAAPQFASSLPPLAASEPAVRLQSWRRRAPSIVSEHEGLATAAATAFEDLGSLRIFDPEVPDRAVVAAGSPWFMTLFGRDSLLTSWMTLLVDPSLAIGTLQTLARLQGHKEDPITEEQPGRILHEVRWGTPLLQGLGDVYYGTVDATPLFVMLVGEVQRWGFGGDIVKELIPHVDRALQWIEDYGDRDGDGFVEYKRMTDRGLLHQGWKDSSDAISFASGRLADPPIALCEVQGYVYAAYRARSRLAEELGDGEGARRFAQKAEHLKRAFNEAFWVGERGWFALGLDADKQQIDALASNMGHCLWTGIIDADKAPQVVRHLLSPAMFSGWGIRTLASSMGAFNPLGYHNGSVWPHDTAIAVAGLIRYGFVEEAQAVTMGLISAAERFGGRLPELFCGFDRSEFEVPVAYPTSCSPQAWAAAGIFLVLRALLGFEPEMPHRELSIAPNLPSELGVLRIENIPLGDDRLSIEASGREVVVRGLPPGVRLRRVPRMARAAV